MPRTAHATVSTGALRGVAVDGIQAFLGVPYAAPPTGAGRWAPPAPVSPWAHVRSAQARAVSAPQPVRPPSRRFFDELPPADEDCLALDLWTPDTRGPARPVVVFLHGGGFAIGGAGSPVLWGARLAQALDAVVVCPNYRLGSLGWLAHPDLAAGPGEAAANWGLLDQRAALRFVAAEVAAFGGDPARVTLVGESAGALSVAHHLGSPATRGLFARAVLMSAPLGERTTPPAVAHAWAQALAETVAPGRHGLRKGLSHASAEAVVAAHELLLTGPPFAGTRGGALPVLDPATIAAEPDDLAAAAPEVDVLVGTNADEAAFFLRLPGRTPELGPEAVRARAAHLPGIHDADRALGAYRGSLGTDDAAELLVRLMTDALFVGPLERWADRRARAGGLIHRYRLEHRSPQHGLGALHSIGVPLLFGTHATTDSGRWVAGDGRDADLAATALQAALRGFVHDGTPGWAPLSAPGPPEVGVIGGSAGGLAVGAPRPVIAPEAFASD